MTPEQDKALQAVLQAIAEAVKTGLTEKQISEKIGLKSEPRWRPGTILEPSDATPRRYGWSPFSSNRKK
jgi:hypothetical protein